MSIASVTQSQPDQIAPYAREETQFGQMVKWFRYDSEMNRDNNTTVKTMKVFLGALLTILLLPFILCIHREVIEQRENEKLLKWQVTQKKNAGEDALIKEIFPNAQINCSIQIQAELLDKTQDEVKNSPPTQAQLRKALIAKPHVAKLLKTTLYDGSAAEGTKPKEFSDEEIAAARQINPTNESKMLAIETELAVQIDIQEKLSKDLEDLRKKTAGWRERVNEASWGLIPKSANASALEQLEKASKTNIDMLRKKLVDIQNNPGDIKAKLKEAETQANQSKSSLSALQSQKDNLQKELEDQKAKLELNTSQTMSLQEKLKEAQEEAETSKTREKTFNLALDALTEKTGNEKKEIENLKKLLIEKNKQIETLKSAGTTNTSSTGGSLRKEREKQILP